MRLIEEEHRTLPGRLIDNLTHAIVSGDIPAGTKISESELATRSVSYTHLTLPTICSV